MNPYLRDQLADLAKRMRESALRESPILPELLAFADELTQLLKEAN